AMRRIHYPHRVAVVGASRDELLAQLAAAAEPDASLPAATTAAGLAFVFSGQGAQWPGMGRELLEQEPVFRRVIETCDELVRAEAGWSVLDLLRAGEDEARLRATEFAQPAIFALQVGLAELLKSWGFVPAAVTGHSVGEIAAAHVAGALSLADATRVVVHRARLMQHAEGLGRMVSVVVAEAEALRAIAAARDRISLAAVNAPATTVLAGDGDALASVVGDLERRGVACQWLAVSYAFHSPQMDPLRAPLVEALGGLRPSRPSLSIVSTVTGRPATDRDFTAEYWGRNLREPVRFAAAVGMLTGMGNATFV